MKNIFENEKIKNVSSITLLVCILFVSVLFIYNHKEELAKISDISIPSIAIISFFIVILIFLNGLMLKVIMEMFTIKLPIKEWLGLTVITTMSNYFMPMRGGVSTRAVYLKKQYSFQYAKFLASMVGTQVIRFVVIGFLGLVTLTVYFVSYGIFYTKPFTVFLFVLSGSILLSLLLKRVNRLRVRFKVVANIIEGFHFFRNKRKKVVWWAVLSALCRLAMAFRIFFAFIALDIEINFLHAMIIGLLTSLSFVLSLTPGNLGIKEAIITFSTQTLGYELTDGFLVAVTIRSLELIITFILGPIFSFVLFKALTLRSENGENSFRS